MNRRKFTTLAAATVLACGMSVAPPVKQPWLIEANYPLAYDDLAWTLPDLLAAGHTESGIRKALTCGTVKKDADGWSLWTYALAS